MKKLIALLLAAVMAFSLVGCADKPDLLGEYEVVLDLTDQIVQEYDAAAMEATGVSLGEYLSEFKLILRFVFNEDGTYKMTLDPNSLTVARENMETALYPLMDDTIISVFGQVAASMGGTVETKEDVEAFFDLSWDTLYMDMFGMEAEELIGSLLEESLASISPADFGAEGKYTAKDGKLIMSDSLDVELTEDAYETYVIEGDTVIVTGAVNLEETGVLPYPYILTKVSE